MRRLFWALILVGAVAGLYLLTPRSVTIVQGADTVTPSGEYGAAGFQIFTFPTFTFPVPTGINTGYCGITGTVDFFGGPSDPVGATRTATFSATLRCNAVVQQPNPQTFSTTYTITGTNEFIVAPPGGDPNGPLHGRTLASGDVLLLDGTTRNTIPAGGTGSLIDYSTLVKPVAQQH